MLGVPPGDAATRPAQLADGPETLLLERSGEALYLPAVEPGELPPFCLRERKPAAGRVRVIEERVAETAVGVEVSQQGL